MNNINNLQLRKFIEIRHELHRTAELSGSEYRTREYLTELLREETHLKTEDRGNWFFAYYESPDENAVNIAFRADFDALPMADKADLEYRSLTEGVSHRCGHDGHSTILFALAELISIHGAANNIYFIFQHGEETGIGARECAGLIKEKNISEIYAIHNWSGFEEGSIVLKSGTAMCASEGLRIIFHGRSCHASRPDDGINPAFALSETALKVKELEKAEEYCDKVMATIVGVNCGGRDFGMAPGEGEIDITLRAEQESDIKKFKSEISAFAVNLAKSEDLDVEFISEDVFPETSNNADAVAKAEEAATDIGLNIIKLEEPIMSSEDFGWYQKECSGAMIFIGNGTDYPQIHTVEYDFNDSIIETAVEFLFKLAGGIYG